MAVDNHSPRPESGGRQMNAHGAMSDTHVQMTWMRCQCGHRWQEGLTLPILTDAFWKRLKAIVCPSCGANYKKIKMELEPESGA